MIRRNIVSFFCNIFIFLMIFTSISTKSFFNPANVAPGLPQADLDFMNSPEFSGMMQEFERELAALPPEERAAFDEMMNEFARVIQEMPEEEFNQLLEDITNDMQMADEMGLLDATEPVNVDVVPSIEIPAPVLQIEIPNEIKELAELLQITKTYLTLLLSKIQIAPDLSLKIDKWMHNQKITGIPTGYSWLQSTEDIEKLISLISIMLETDTKSKPVFLFEIHKDENLESLLHELATVTSSTSTLDISEFGIKQEKETNEQIQHIISELSQLMLQKGLLQKLQTIAQSKSKDTITREGSAKTVMPTSTETTSTEATSIEATSTKEPSIREAIPEFDEEDYTFEDNW